MELHLLPVPGPGPDQAGHAAGALVLHIPRVPAPGREAGARVQLLGDRLRDHRSVVF